MRLQTDGHRGQKQRKTESIIQPRSKEYCIPTCGGVLTGRGPVQRVLELRHSTKHVTNFGPHKEAAAVPAGPRALQDGLPGEQTEG